MPEPEKLGYITAPSGTIIVLDAGLMNLWTHNKPPLLPEGVLSSRESEQRANESKDLRVVGPDAWAAGVAYDRDCHPLYIYDIPDYVELVEHFAAFAKEKNFDAVLEPLDERITHRDRIDRLLADGIPENGISFHGIWAAIATGLPTDHPLPVYGRKCAQGTESEDRWNEVYVSTNPGAQVVRSERRGYAAVDEARLMFADVDALGGWVHEEALDGKADFVFWGADAEIAAKATFANALSDDTFGWTDLSVAKALEICSRVENLRDNHAWRYATDFRPHSHHWQAMEQVRATKTESGIVDLGDAVVCVFMTSWGDGLFDVHADYDSQDNLVQIRVALGGED